MAKKNKETVIEVCRRIATECNTPALILNAVIDKLRSSIRLVPKADSEATPPTSFIGGLPTVPDGFEWPRFSGTQPYLRAADYETLLDKPYAFLAQVDLSEVRPFDLEQLLPTDGVLQFFYLDFGWHDVSWPEGRGVVRYHPQSAAELRPANLPSDLDSRRVFRSFPLVPEQEWTVPAHAELELEEKVPTGALDFWTDVREEVAQCQGLKSERVSRHRMLGYAEFIQSPGMAEETRLLMQIDSDPVRGQESEPCTGMTWGDAGTVYFFMDESDLETREWEQAWAEIEMC